MWKPGRIPVGGASSKTVDKDIQIGNKEMRNVTTGG